MCLFFEVGRSVRRAEQHRFRQRVAQRTHGGGINDDVLVGAHASACAPSHGRRRTPCVHGARRAQTASRSSRPSNWSMKLSPSACVSFRDRRSIHMPTRLTDELDQIIYEPGCANIIHRTQRIVSRQANARSASTTVAHAVTLPAGATVSSRSRNTRSDWCRSALRCCRTARAHRDQARPRDRLPVVRVHARVPRFVCRHRCEPARAQRL